MRAIHPREHEAAAMAAGWGHLLIAGFAGIALTALYLWRRNLGVNILAHAVLDGAAILTS